MMFRPGTNRADFERNFHNSGRFKRTGVFRVPQTGEYFLTRSGHVLHGFTLGRSPVTNALAHVGLRYTLTFDLRDFFDSVVPRMTVGLLTKDQRAQVFIDPGDGGGTRAVQGLPTSPAVANMAASKMDVAILSAVARIGQVVYTRYADDLTFSFDHPAIREWLLSNIPVVVAANGFAINERKTRFMPASAGRRHITGVAVDAGINPTRATKRKLRAAQFQAAHDGRARRSAVGLSEWCKLKLPKAARPKKHGSRHYDLGEE